ncbi:hypothetical protein AB0N89_33895 [Amycolatopsis sp. NPDC089917]|uniref:hypothetical protein n=1 Tax=Amycolatopsis sp. NPDC089917 TaxID=3155187 RepID=UPI003417D7C8
MTDSAFGASRPPIPGVLQNGGQRVVQAGAVYLPMLLGHGHGDGLVHWMYGPKVRIGRAELWCKNRNTGQPPLESSAEGMSPHLGFAPPCQDCAVLAPLPTKAPEPES